MRTELQRNMGSVQPMIMVSFPLRTGYVAMIKSVSRNSFSKDQSMARIPTSMPVSPQISRRNTMGDMSWLGEGLAQLPDDVSKALKSKAEGGSGAAQTFWDYCDRETKSFR